MSTTETPPPADPVAFLDTQARHAQAAFVNVLTRLKDTLSSPLTQPSPTSPSPDSASISSRLMTEHPYVSLTGALATGFLTAAIFVPSKEQQVLRKLAALERAVALHGSDTNHPKSQAGGLSGALIGSIAAVLKPALLQIITAGMAARTATDMAAQNASEQTGPGQPAEADGHLSPN